MHNEQLALRAYIQLLFKRWPIIVAVVSIVVIGVVALLVAGPSTYEGEATVAMLRSRTEVEFDSRIRTLSDFQLSSAGLTGRQDALVALVTGNQVVQQVLNDVSGQLHPDDRTMKALRDMVHTETVGDLININIRHEDPEIAALIANSWAENYAQVVNDIYSSSPVIGSDVAGQVAAAEQRYQDAQQALEAFIGEEQVRTLEREISARTALLESYQQTLMRIGVAPSDKSELLLIDYYRELQQVENWLAAANSLREQVSRDANSPAAELGNTIALLTLRTKIFSGGSDPALPGEIVAATQTQAGSAAASAPQSPQIREGASAPALVLQLDVSNVAEATIDESDVDAVISVLEQRREDTQARIEALVDEINSGALAGQTPAAASPQLLAQVLTLEQEIAALNSELEGQGAKRRELLRARDRAWDTYQVLVGRQVEQEIVSESPAAEVRLADAAIVPTEPVSRGLLRNTALAALAALTLSVGAIIAWDWWQRGDEDLAAAHPVEPAAAPGRPDEADYAEAPAPGAGRTGRLPDSVT